MGADDYFHFEYFWYIWHPGADEAEEREGWASDRPEATRLTDLLHEFGAEGWELVSAETTRSAATQKQFGWLDTSSFPIEQRWTFKRPAASR
jgi:hypothetical protein